MEIKRKKFNRTVPRVAMLGADNSNDQQSLIMTVRQMQSYIMELQRQLDALQRTVSAVESSLEPENLSALLDSVGGKQESVVPDTTVNIDDGGSDDVTWTYMDDRLRKSTAYSEDAEADGAPIRYAAFYEVALSSDLAALPTDIEPAFAYVSSDGSYYMIQDGSWVQINDSGIVTAISKAALPASTPPKFGYVTAGAEVGRYYDRTPSSSWEALNFLE